MIIRPFGYRDEAAFWDISDPRLAVLIHSITGGTPAYRREFVAGDSPASLADFDARLLRTVLNRGTTPEGRSSRTTAEQVSMLSWPTWRLATRRFCW